MRYLWLVIGFLLLAPAVHAQDSLVVQTCGTLPLAYKVGATRNDTVDINGNKCISGSISASFASFHMTSALTPLGATTSSQTSPSFTAGSTIVVSNTGTTNAVFCQPGATATLSSQPIAPNNGWFVFATTSETTIACLTSTSTTNVNFAVGSGGPAGTGGGGGGGSGGNVTIVGPLNQQLAAASIPVVLTAAQITTLTPLATITANQGTPAAVSSPWPTIGGELAADATGTFTNATQTNSVTQTGLDGYGTAMVSIQGTYGTATGVFELSDDAGTTWYAVQGARIDSCTVELGYTTLTNTNRVWTIPVSGADSFRLRSTAVASGTVTVRISISSAVPPTSTAICGSTSIINGANTVAVKAASTAAAAADPSFVTNESPNSQLSVAAGTTADVPCTSPATSTACTQIALLKALLNTGQYPAGATAITASATGTTAATTATLAGTAGKTTYICGYSIRANATAAITVTNTITGVITATLSSIMWVAPLASGIGVDEQIFNPCIPASATNTGIAIVSGAPGSGGTVSSKGWGYQL